MSKAELEHGADPEVLVLRTVPTCARTVQNLNERF
jgi:hypothetical protein